MSEQAKKIKRTEPTRHLYQGAAYVNAAATDIRATFRRILESQAKPANVQPLKKTRKA